MGTHSIPSSTYLVQDSPRGRREWETIETHSDADGAYWSLRSQCRMNAATGLYGPHGTRRLRVVAK